MRRQYQPTLRNLLTIAAMSAVVGTTSCFAGTDASDLQAATPDDEVATAAAVPVVELTAPPVAEEAPIKAFIGTYKHTGGMPEQRALWGKIESMANSFNFFARGIVKDKLAASNQIAKEIRIEADSETLVIYFDKGNQTAPLDGSSVKFKAVNGENMDMSFKVERGKIEQTFVGNAKGRVNTYELQGDKLVLHVSIKAAQLPKELAYDLTYERVPAATEAAPTAAK